jgi:hypothetical protein
LQPMTSPSLRDWPVQKGPPVVGAPGQKVLSKY